MAIPFPAAAAILDPLVSPVGNMTTGNWIAATDGSNPMQITATGACASVQHANNTALWAKPVPIFQYAFATIAVQPGATGGSNYCQVGGMNDTAFDNWCYVNLFNTGVFSLSVPNGGTTLSVGTVLNGDAMGCTYDPVADVATAYYRHVNTLAWVNVGTVTPTGIFPPSLQVNWFLFLGGGDAANLRIRDFGGGLAADASVTAPAWHGRGAC